jgi:PAS domain S-box-containing protein
MDNLLQKGDVDLSQTFQTLSALSSCVYWKDEKGMYQGSNSEYCKALGLKKSTELRQRTDLQLFYDQKQAQNRYTVDQSIIQSGSTKIIEEQIGNQIYRSEKVSLKDTAGKVIGLLNISTDITAQKQIEKKYKELDNIVENLPGHVYWMNREGIYQGCNNNDVKYHELNSREEIVGKTVYDFFDDIGAAVISKTNEEVMSNNQIKILEEGETRKDYDKESDVYLSHKVPLHDEQGNVTGMLGVSLNITEHKNKEKALEISKFQLENVDQKNCDELKELVGKVTGQAVTSPATSTQYAQMMCDFYENLIAVMPGNIYWKNKEGIYLGCNDQDAKYLGFKSRQEIIGKTLYDFFPKEAAEIIDKVDISVMQEGKANFLEESEGNRVYLSHKIPLHDKSGQVIGLLGISFDITERKALEKQLKETEIREKIQGERVEAMRIIAASIAHELRTPLRSIGNVLFGVSKHLPELIETYRIAAHQQLDTPFMREETLSDMIEGLNQVRREINYTNSIIDMLLVSLKDQHMDATKFVKLSMKECVSEALNRYTFRELHEAKLVHWKDANDFQFIGDGLLITHIIFNLLRNALFFVQKAAKGDVHIWLERGEKFNELHVKDTGAGISSDVLPYIFDRFFTHRQGGTGVGLAFCQSAMKDMGGDIQCESSLGEYTEFIMMFPVVK